MTTGRTPEHHIALERRRGFQLEGPAGTTIRVTQGEVWITRHHDTKDYLLVAGGVLVHQGKGKTLVTAIKKDARVQILRPAASTPIWTAFRKLFRSASDAALLDEIPYEEETPSAILRAGGPPRPTAIRFCSAGDGSKIAYAKDGCGPPLVRAAFYLNHLERTKWS